MKFCFVIQSGRLESEALLLAESIVFSGAIAPESVVVCYPEPSPLWPTNPEPSRQAIESLLSCGVSVTSFGNADYGATYPISNKIYAIRKVGRTARDVFFIDSDCLFLGEVETLIGGTPGPTGNTLGACTAERSFPRKSKTYSDRDIWGAIYRKFGIDPDAAVGGDGAATEGGAFPYFNAGALFIRNAAAFCDLWLRVALEIDKRDIPELDGQKIYPFLDQISLPVAMALGGWKHEPLDPRINSNHVSEDVRLWHYHYPYRIYEALTSKDAGRARVFMRAFIMSHIKHSLCRDLILAHEGFGYFLNAEKWDEIASLYTHALNGMTVAQRHVFWNRYYRHRGG